MLTGRRETLNPDFFRAGKLYIKPLTSAEADSNFVRVSRGLFIVLELSVWVGFFMCSTLKKITGGFNNKLSDIASQYKEKYQSENTKNSH